MKPRTSPVRWPALRMVAAASLVAAAASIATPAAGADQLSTLKAQAAALAQRIQTLGQQEEALSEQYDGATLDLQAATVREGQAAQSLATAQTAASAARKALGQEAIDAYTGQAEAPTVGAGSLGTTTAGLLGAEYVNSLASSREDALDSYRLATAEAKTAQATLAQAQAAANAQVQTLGKDRTAVQATDGQLEGAYQQDQGQIATLVAQIQAAQEAAQAAAAAKAAQQRAAAQALAQQEAAQAAPQPTQVAPALQSAIPAARSTDTAGPQEAHPQASGALTGPSPVAGPSEAPPPVGSGASGAVAAALSRVGDPYVWGASGPGDFDCSGLVMWAYAQVGISLPHFSGAQYADGVKIPMSDLEPGDLVFFADPGQHVAMYIGGGDIIEAPHTGADVHVVPMYSEFVQAVRIA